MEYTLTLVVCESNIAKLLLAMQLDFSECKPVNACSCFVAYLSPYNGILARYKLENL